MNNLDLSKPEPTEDFRDYLTEAHYCLTDQQENCRLKFGIDDWERWHYDDETGFLEFFNGDVLKLRIKYQQVGTVSKTLNTWLWAWANSDLSDNIKLVSNEANKLGEQRKFERLTKQKWNADQIDGWEMTSILAYLMNAKGAYRIPGENVFKYIIFTDIELMNEKESM